MESVSSPLVSVLTPVYNGAKYLSECIQSVLAQTYNNWEHVIVNNCSTDRSLEIAQNFAAKDRRIRVINNKKFVGLYRNHNIAVRQMSRESKYCKFVHADDWLFPECISRMVELAEEHSSVGIVSSYALEGNKVWLTGLPYPSTVVPGREICRSSLLGGPYLFGTPTSLLFRADLVRRYETFFNESHIHSDTETCYELLQDSDFGFVHQVLTFSRVHEEQATRFSVRLNTYLLGKLERLLQYGPKFLTGGEYEERLKELLRRYHRFLGRRVFRANGKELRDFHLSKLAALGYPVSRYRLFRASCLELMRLLGDTKRLMQTLRETSSNVKYRHRAQNLSEMRTKRILQLPEGKQRSL